MTKQQRANIVIHELKRCIPKAKMALTYKNNWQLLVAVVLSAQTTDKQVNKVTHHLFAKYAKLDDYYTLPVETLEEEIKSIGLYKSKAKNILAAANNIKQKHNGRLPKTMEELLALPGVGRKTANVLLTQAYGITEGIAVDTHVKRLSQLFGLTKQAIPKKIENDLMQIIPPEEWSTFTLRMIDYGRQFCPTRCTHEHCPIYTQLKDV